MVYTSWPVYSDNIVFKGVECSTKGVECPPCGPPNATLIGLTYTYTTCTQNINLSVHSSIFSAHTPAPLNIVDPDTNEEVIPQITSDPNTGDDGITDTSAAVSFTLPAEIEMNGPVDK